MMKFSIFLLFFIPVTALAEAYRWVDEHGRVHFSDRAPTHIDAEAIPLPAAQESSQPADVSAEEQRRRQDVLVRVLEKERLAREAEKREQEEQRLERERKCERFKNRLAYLDRASRIYDEREDGTRRYLNDAENQQYRDEVKRKYREHCVND